MSIKFTDLLNVPKSDAIQTLKSEYERTRDLGILYNLNLILFDISDWQQAKSNCIKIINERDHTSEGDFIKLGMIEWFLGDFSSAIKYWRQSLKTEYINDPIGPINGPLVLWYAGIQLHNDKLIKESIKKLERFWKVQDFRVFNEWPGTIAIAGFLMDKVPVNVFLHEWEWAKLEDRRRCRANFWVGMKCIEEKNEKTAIAYFKSAFSGPKIAILEYEYFLAKWEYSRLTGENLWTDKINQ